MIIERLLSLVAPFDCIACGEEGALLCSGCAQDALPSLPSRCYRCTAVTRESAVCNSCRPAARLRHAWVACEYDGVAKRLVYRLKFGRAKAAAGIMAAHLDDILPHLAPDTLVTHVPTATSRVRLRGYDHAQLIAQQFARKRGLRYAPLLGRLGQSRQVGAARAERQKQLREAYRSRNPQRIAGASVLVIDDVLTTGATVEAAAHALREAGARHVDAALFAQRTAS